MKDRFLTTIHNPIDIQSNGADRDSAALATPARRHEVTEAAIAAALEGFTRPPLRPSPEHAGGLMRVGIYASASGTHDRMSSLGRQIRFCISYADRLWQASFAIFADVQNTRLGAFSPRTESWLLRLLTACDRGEIRVVVVEDVTRLGRDIDDISEVMRRFAAAGVVVHCAIDGREIDEAASLVAGMRAMEDRRRRRAMSIAGRRHLRSRGGIPHPAPFGYRAGATRGYPEIDPAAAAVIVRIFDMAGEGRSCNGIARDLADQGVAGPSGPGRWSGGTVRRILGHSMYVGRIRVEDDEDASEVWTAFPRSRRLRRKASFYQRAERYRIVDEVRYLRVVRRRTKHGK